MFAEDEGKDGSRRLGLGAGVRDGPVGWGAQDAPSRRSSGSGAKTPSPGGTRDSGHPMQALCPPVPMGHGRPPTRLSVAQPTKGDTWGAWVSRVLTRLVRSLGALFPAPCVFTEGFQLQQRAACRQGHLSRGVRPEHALWRVPCCSRNTSPGLQCQPG